MTKGFIALQEIRDIFTGDGCPPMISCEYVVNDNWYVHFGSEEDANRAYRFVKETKKTFLDKPIMVSLLSDSVSVRLSSLLLDFAFRCCTIALGAALCVPTVKFNHSMIRERKTETKIERDRETE